jgi:hypothetical protein
LTKISVLVCAFLSVTSPPLRAAESPEEKAFLDTYKTAFEANDTATLQSFLYTKGADPAIVGFYKMMQAAAAGSKISSIQLLHLTPEDVKKAATPLDSPTGGKVCLPLKPSKKLLITIERKEVTGSSTSNTQNFIAESDGKFVIPVPGPCK